MTLRTSSWIGYKIEPTRETKAINDEQEPDGTSLETRMDLEWRWRILYEL